MEKDSIQRSLKLFIVLSRAHRSINDIVNKHIAEHGLNPTEFAVLELLYHKGDQPIQIIGKKVSSHEKRSLLRWPCPWNVPILRR